MPPINAFPPRVPFTSLLAFLIPAGFGARVVSAATPYDSALWFQYSEPFRLNLLLPSTGPEASSLNPARLGDANRGYSLIASENGGKVSTGALEAGIGIAHKLYLGLSSVSTGGRLSGTSAALTDGDYQIRAAYRVNLDLTGQDFWSVGYAQTFHQLNTYNVMKTINFDEAVGFLFKDAPRQERPGMELSLAFRNLTPISLTLQQPLAQPDYERKSYRLYQLETDAGMGLTSPDDKWRADANLSVFGANHEAYPDGGFSQQGWDVGPVKADVYRFGIEYRPWTFTALRIERLWNRYWVFGFCLRPTFWGMHFNLAANFTKGRFLEYSRPDPSGRVSSYLLSADW